MTFLMLLGSIGFSLCLLGCSKLRAFLGFFLISSLSLLAVVFAYFLLRFVRAQMQSFLATVAVWFLMPRYATVPISRLQKHPHRRTPPTPRFF